MNKCVGILAALAMATALASARSSLFPEQSTVRESWIFPAGAASMEVAVDNIDGPITITGQPGRSVEMVAVRTDRADLPERLRRAKEEVQLRLTRRDDLFEAYVDAPWRCQDGTRGYGRNSPGYSVQYDFQLKVPSEATLFLRTVNHGEIQVNGVRGDYDVHNINGGIEMSDVAGSGRAYALNGKLHITFRGNPARDSYFGSLNGDVDLFFQPGLSADLLLKTFNGEIYSDFEVAPLPSGPISRETQGNKHVYRANRFFGVRVGRGGPEIKLDGFNGDIRLHERRN
jgi:hypothetical protein